MLRENNINRKSDRKQFISKQTRTDSTCPALRFSRAHNQWGKPLSESHCLPLKRQYLSLAIGKLILNTSYWNFAREFRALTFRSNEFRYFVTSAIVSLLQCCLRSLNNLFYLYFSRRQTSSIDDRKITCKPTASVKGNRSVFLEVCFIKYCEFRLANSVPEYASSFLVVRRSTNATHV